VQPLVFPRVTMAHSSTEVGRARRGRSVVRFIRVYPLAINPEKKNKDFHGPT
jgi:hypothetical protein